MTAFGIGSLEQCAMFLAQLDEESAGLNSWSEKYNGSSADSYFIHKYWVQPSQWTGLGAAVPKVNGLTLKLKDNGRSSAENLLLYWAQGPTLASSATLYGRHVFKRVGKYYVSDFKGAVPPKYTTYLLIVKPKTQHVLLAIHNKLGNWSPQDATDFRGRGPIQLTGRYNYQSYADYANSPDVMTDPTMLADSANNPLVGMQAAGWFWEALNKHELNALTDSFAGESSVEFNTAVTAVINPGLNGLQDRLNFYLFIRSQMLNMTS